MYSHVQAKVYSVKFNLKQTGLFSISSVSWNVSCLSLKLKPFLRNAITKWTTAWNKIELAFHLHKNHLDTTKNEHGTFTGLVWISTVTLHYLANQLVLQALSLQAVRLRVPTQYKQNYNHFQSSNRRNFTPCLFRSGIVCSLRADDFSGNTNVCTQATSYVNVVLPVLIESYQIQECKPNDLPIMNVLLRSPSLSRCHIPV